MSQNRVRTLKLSNYSRQKLVSDKTNRCEIYIIHTTYRHIIAILIALTILPHRQKKHLTVSYFSDCTTSMKALLTRSQQTTVLKQI
jgi:hypothetical protein